MEKTVVLYEGKAKKAYGTSNPRVIWMEFKDTATAFDGVKKGSIQDKGRINAALSAHLFGVLERAGIPTHFIERADERSLLVRNLKMFPVEVVVRNAAAGSIEKRYGLEHGTRFRKPLLEYFLKNDSLHDPMLNRQHVVVLGYMPERKLARAEELALKVNTVLSRYMKRRGFFLVDFKLEFGEQSGRVYLGDEISPDTCRIWDAGTGEIMDKDRFRLDLGAVEEHYEEVLRRLTA